MSVNPPWAVVPLLSACVVLMECNIAAHTVDPVASPQVGSLQSDMRDEGPTSSASKGLEKLSWLSGSLRYEQDSLIIEEQWMTPVGDAMFGMSRTLSGGRVVGFEFLELRQDGDSLVYTAQPNGQCPGTKFVGKLPASDVVGLDVVEFVNPTNDFPRKITYAREGDDGVRASISNDEKSIDIKYRRIE